MGLRIYLCPVVGNGVDATPYRPKLATLADCAVFLPNNVDGTPKFTWTIALARQTSWTALDADATLERLLGIDLPDTINSFSELKTFLQSRVVGDIPTARRADLNSKLTSRGMDTAQFTGSSTWWEVLRGIYRFLNGGADLRNDGPGS